MPEQKTRSYRPPSELVIAAEMGLLAAAPKRRADELPAWRAVARIAVAAPKEQAATYYDGVSLVEAYDDLERRVEELVTRTKGYAEAGDLSRPVSDEALVFAVRVRRLLVWARDKFDEAYWPLSAFRWKDEGDG